MKKALFALLAAIAGFAISMAVGYLFMFIVPSLNAEYMNTNIFRPWDDPLMMLYYLHPIYITIVLIWAWDKVKGLYSGTLVKNAFLFTSAIFAISTFPGMLMSISSFKISFIMTLSWSIGAFLQTFVIILVYGRLNK